MLYNTSHGKTFTIKSFALVFAETYPLYGESNSKILTDSCLLYRSQWLVMLTSFLNLPNDKRLSDTLSVTDLLKNSIHWSTEDEKKGRISIPTKVLAIPRICYHAMAVMLAIPSSTAKLITEFLPGLAEEALYLAKINEREKTAKYYVLKAAHAIVSGVHWIGRTITPSVKGFFPDLSRDGGIAKMSRSAIIYYGLLLTVLCITLAVAAIMIFKISPLAFTVLSLAFVSGLIHYVGSNVYGFFATVKPSLCSNDPSKDYPGASYNRMHQLSQPIEPGLNHDTTIPQPPVEIYTSPLNRGSDHEAEGIEMSIIENPAMN